MELEVLVGDADDHFLLLVGMLAPVSPWHCLQCKAGEHAGVTRAGAASQAFERMHNTLSHRLKT